MSARHGTARGPCHPTRRILHPASSDFLSSATLHLHSSTAPSLQYRTQLRSTQPYTLQSYHRERENPTNTMATSVFSRKRDLVYLIYFCIAVPMGLSTCLKPVLSPLILLQPISYPRLYSLPAKPKSSKLRNLPDNDHVTVVDLQPIYPPSLIPAWMTGITDFYVNTYHDQFFVNTPPFFNFFLYTELFIQIPTEIWAIGALRRSMPRPFSPSHRFW